jgi:hypothetical protein
MRLVEDWRAGRGECGFHRRRVHAFGGAACDRGDARPAGCKQRRDMARIHPVCPASYRATYDIKDATSNNTHATANVHVDAGSFSALQRATRRDSQRMRARAQRTPRPVWLSCLNVAGRCRAAQARLPRHRRRWLSSRADGGPSSFRGMRGSMMAASLSYGTTSSTQCAAARSHTTPAVASAVAQSGNVDRCAALAMPCGVGVLKLRGR